MRQLRFVRSADQGNFVIVETADGLDQFSLLVDAGLRDAVRSDLPRLTPPKRTDPEPATVGPREIQTRVRGGESAEAIAAEYDLPLDRVLRFAGPVLEERARIADEARRGRARRGSGDGQLVIFGEAVDARYAAHGIDPITVSWDARRREDGQWVIAAGWHGGDADRVAEWVFHLATRTVSALDETAGDLLSDRPIRPVSTPVDGPVRPSLAAAPPLAPGVVAFPVMADARTGPLPTSDEVFDQNAQDPDAPRRPVEHRAQRRADRRAERRAAESRPAERSERAEGSTMVTQAAEPTEPTEPTGVTAVPYDAAPFDVAPMAEAQLPLNIPEPTTLPSVKNLGLARRHAAPEPSDEERAARTRIPTWDDILLGVRRKGD